MAQFPDIRVTRRGPYVTKVEWRRDGEPSVDLTDMKVLKVERVIDPGSLPVVCVSFVACIVEVEES